MPRPCGDVGNADVGALGGRDLGQVLTHEGDAAALEGFQTGEDAQKRGLAGAVGADQGNDLALVHMHADVEQHLQIAITGAKVFDLKHHSCDLLRYMRR